MRPNNFDLIRFLAAAQVLLVHGVEHLGLSAVLKQEGSFLWFALSAFPGVPIFFFISGFLISRSYERDSDNRRYAYNRLLRIYPGLWVCFACSILSVFVVYPRAILNAPLWDFVAWTVAQLSILQFYNPSFLRSYGVGVLNGSLWTIPVELQFYFAVPVLYYAGGLLKGKRNLQLGITTLFFLLFAVVYREYLEFSLQGVWSKLINVSMLPYFWIFLLGVLAQRNWAELNWCFESRVHWWAFAYLIVIVFGYWEGVSVTGNRQSPFAVVILIGVVLSFAFSHRTLAESLLQGNDFSYGIYIYHMVIINVLLHLGFRGQWWHLILAATLTLLAAVLSWKWVESSAIALKPARTV